MIQGPTLGYSPPPQPLPRPAAPAAPADNTLAAAASSTMRWRWLKSLKRRSHGLDGKRLGVVQSATIHLLSPCLAQRHLLLVGSQRQLRRNRQRDRRHRQSHRHIQPLLRVGGDDNQGSRIRIFYGVIGGYILPLPNALLGATAFGLRALSEEIAASTTQTTAAARADICGSCSPRLPVR